MLTKRNWNLNFAQHPVLDVGSVPLSTVATTPLSHAWVWAFASLALPGALSLRL